MLEIGGAVLSTTAEFYEELEGTDAATDSRCHALCFKVHSLHLAVPLFDLRTRGANHSLKSFLGLGSLHSIHFQNPRTALGVQLIHFRVASLRNHI